MSFEWNEWLNGFFAIFGGFHYLRGLKTEDTPIIPMPDIYYNYIRPHQALNGQTPAQAAGVGIEDKNKWFGLVKKSLEIQHRPEVTNPN